MTEEDKILEEVTGADYKYGFTTDIESDKKISKGLNEDVIRLISKKKTNQIGYSNTGSKRLILEKNARTQLGKHQIPKA